MSPVAKPITERFWPRVNKAGPIHAVLGTPCWLWTGAPDNRGYGRLSTTLGGSVLKAHRLSWEIANGAIPEGLCVLHRCDNPPCVNPEHLFLGTRPDNARDMADKGRHGRYNAKKTHCKRGHEFTAENTLTHGASRACRICANAWKRDHPSKKRRHIDLLSHAA